jgi:hypothetical protein
VNNYERAQELPPKTNVQFLINLPCGSLAFPQHPVTIPSDACLIWPFNLDLGRGLRLVWATAQPLTAIEDGNVRTVFFAETKGVPAQFAFDTNGPTIEVLSGHLARGGNANILSEIRSGTGVAARAQLPNGHLIQIVLLDEKSSLALWQGNLQGRDRAFLTEAGLVLDGNNVRLTSADPPELKLDIYPAPNSLVYDGSELSRHRDGIFQRFTPPAPPAARCKVDIESIQSAGPLREIPLGKIENPVAAAPLDQDFANAAVWSVRIPAGVDLENDPLLRVHYVGDVARVMLNGRLITDDFYNGNAFDIGLRRHASGILNGDLRIAILPLRRDAPVYMDDHARPHFGNADSIAALKGVEIVPRYQLQLTAR